ncbi:hypothetical protein AVEN_100251-1 [Araneus ventricosus]|uniref:Uncharacterized protein n=1 Tax=Araneus ventricosus TaxID=182803 RepID=A0A4Y2LKA8_ARAVE|nr:hypothetical protein AVEN_100251-1 [Araneus ventricosus]
MGTKHELQRRCERVNRTQSSTTSQVRKPRTHDKVQRKPEYLGNLAQLAKSVSQGLMTKSKENRSSLVQLAKSVNQGLIIKSKGKPEYLGSARARCLTEFRYVWGMLHSVKGNWPKFEFRLKENLQQPTQPQQAIPC